MNILIQGNIFKCSGFHAHTALPQLFTPLTTWACQKLWEHHPKTLNRSGQPHLLSFRPEEGAFHLSATSRKTSFHAIKSDKSHHVAQSVASSVL